MPSPPVALVTGGAIRVGAEIVRHLLGRGFRVWLHCHRSEAAARRLRDELAQPQSSPPALSIIVANLSQPEHRVALVERVCAADGPYQGRLDLLVNSAASFERGPFDTRSDSDLQRVLELNLVAPLSLARSLLPPLRNSGAGKVINIVDLGALHPWHERTDHCVAKAGLAMATRSLALEWAPGVRVNAIAPGTVLWPEGPEFAPDSSIRREVASQIPLGDIGSPKHVCATIDYLLDVDFVTGQVLAVDGGRTANFGI